MENQKSVLFFNKNYDISIRIHQIDFEWVLANIPLVDLKGVLKEKNQNI